MNYEHDKIGILVGSNCDKIWKEHLDTYCLSNLVDTNIKQDEALDDEDDDIFEELVESKRELILRSTKQDVEFPYNKSNMENSLESIIKSEIAEEKNLNSLILKTEEIDIKTEEDTYVFTRNSFPKIKTENEKPHIKIKEVDRHSDCPSNYNTIRKKPIKSIKKREKMQLRQNKKTIYKCEYCIFKSRHQGSLNVHSLRHKDPSEVKMHQCLHCEYQSIHKYNLQVHTLRRHIPRDKIKVPKLELKHHLECQYKKCPKCDYQTSDKSNLRRHIFLHDKTKKLQYACDKCGVTVSTKYALKCHILRHNTDKTNILNPFSVKKCQHCDFKTKYKQNLLIHKLEHEDSKKIKVYVCENCDYRTIYKHSIEKHTVKHTKLQIKAANMALLKCNNCSFKTATKSSLDHHKLLHKSCAEVDIYKCSECDYKTIHKGNLNRHAKRYHASEVEIYQCYECNHKTTRKDELKNHIFRHEKFKNP